MSLILKLSDNFKNTLTKHVVSGQLIESCKTLNEFMIVYDS